MALAENDQLLIDVATEELEPAGAEGEEDLTGLDPATISDELAEYEAKCKKGE